MAADLTPTNLTNFPTDTFPISLTNSLHTHRSLSMAFIGHPTLPDSWPSRMPKPCSHLNKVHGSRKPKVNNLNFSNNFVIINFYIKDLRGYRIVCWPFATFLRTLAVPLSSWTSVRPLMNPFVSTMLIATRTKRHSKYNSNSIRLESLMKINF